MVSLGLSLRGWTSFGWAQELGLDWTPNLEPTSSVLASKLRSVINYRESDLMALMMPLAWWTWILCFSMDFYAFLFPLSPGESPDIVQQCVTQRRPLRRNWPRIGSHSAPTKRGKITPNNTIFSGKSVADCSLLLVLWLVSRVWFVISMTTCYGLTRPGPGFSP